MSVNNINSDLVVSEASSKKPQISPALSPDQNAQLMAFLTGFANALSKAAESHEKQPAAMALATTNDATAPSAPSSPGMGQVLDLQLALAGVNSSILLTNLQDGNTSGNISAQLSKVSAQMAQDILAAAQKAQEKSENESGWQKFLGGIKKVFEAAVIGVLAMFPGTQGLAATLAVLMVAQLTGATKDIVNVVAKGLEDLGVPPGIAKTIAGALVEAAAVIVTAVATGGASVVEDVKTGAKDVEEGVKSIKEGVQDIERGVGDVRDGVKKIQDGAAQVKDGAAKMKDAVSTGNAKELKSGAEEIKTGAKGIKDGAASVEEGVDTIGQADNDINESLQQIKDGVADIETSVKDVKDAIGDGKKGLNFFKNLSSRTNMTLMVATQVASQVNLLGNIAQTLPEGSKAREIVTACADAIQVTASLVVGLGAGSALISEAGQVTASLQKTALMLQNGAQIAQGVVGLAQGGLSIGQGFTQQTLTTLNTLASLYRSSSTMNSQMASANLSAANAIMSSLIQSLNSMVTAFAKADEILPAMMSGNPV
jgi:X-X-X-Leu-X-X-Gly heptad repeat protein